jgi:hypothetical protein
VYEDEVGIGLAAKSCVKEAAIFRYQKLQDAEHGQVMYVD